MNNEVEMFIRGFKEKYPNEVTDLFMYGYCYWFAYILVARFNGDLWFCPDIVHFATEIYGVLYDITGRVNTTNGQWFRWNDYLHMLYKEGREDEAFAIIDTCVNKSVTISKKSAIEGEEQNV